MKAVDTKDHSVKCCVKENNVKLSQSEQICQSVHQMLQGRTTGKATIKIEVGFSE